MNIKELSKLSDEELCVMCAELCGWTKLVTYTTGVPGVFGINPHPLPDEEGKMDFAPNYPADLNAMHEAEKSIFFGYEQETEAQHKVRVAYENALIDLAENPLHIEARQRCIAFIATKQP